MSIAKQFPLFGVLAGIALLIVGFINNNNALLIVGGILVVFGLFRIIKK